MADKEKLNTRFLAALHHMNERVSFAHLGHTLGVINESSVNQVIRQAFDKFLQDVGDEFLADIGHLFSADPEKR